MSTQYVIKYRALAGSWSTSTEANFLAIQFHLGKKSVENARRKDSQADAAGQVK